MERDLFTSGDGLLTFDSQSGLEWLDVSQTLLEDYPGALLEDRYQAVLAETVSGGRFAGFVPADIVSGRALLDASGIDLEAIDFATNGDAASRLLDLLDAPMEAPDRWRLNALTSATGSDGPDTTSRTAVAVDIRTVVGLSQVAEAGFVGGYRIETFTFPSPNNIQYSVLLVRQAIPEPAAGFMVVLSVALMSLLHGRACRVGARTYLTSLNGRRVAGDEAEGVAPSV